MNIINTLEWRKGLAALSAAALIMFALGLGQTARADHIDVHVSAATDGAVVMDGTGTSTVLSTFAPDLNLASSTSAALQASATSSVTAYYGVDIESSTTTGDVYWQITVSHATEALTVGDVSITEKGYFDADGGVVADSGYAPTAVSGDLVFTGNAGWEVFDGDMFTNIDAITFDNDAPLGTYTITRALIDNSTDAAIDGSFSFTVNLTAAPVLTPSATSTPVITITGDNPQSFFICNGFVEPGFTAVDSTGASITATSNVSTLNFNESGTYTITYTATDSSGNTATTTRTVIALECNSGGGSSRPGDNASSRVPSGLVNASANASANSAVGLVLAGQIDGRLNMPGLHLGQFIQVLGATTAFTFVSDLSIGARGSEVAELQRRLAETGYFRGPITGYFGPITRDALMRLQRANGLSATGMLDAQTRFMLNNS